MSKALEALYRIETVLLQKRVTLSIIEDVQTIRSGLTEKPQIEELDEALKDVTSNYIGDGVRGLLFSNERYRDAVLQAAQSYQASEDTGACQSCNGTGWWDSPGADTKCPYCQGSQQALSKVSDE